MKGYKIDCKKQQAGSIDETKHVQRRLRHFEFSRPCHMKGMGTTTKKRGCVLS